MARQRRRFPALLSAALAAVLALTAACGSDSGTDSGGKTVLTWWDYFGYSPTADNAVKSLIAAYEKSHPNVTINRTAIGFADFHTKLLQAAATGTFPDIAAIDNADVPVFAKQGVLADLTSKIQNWAPLKEFLDPVVESVKSGQAYYGVPFRSNTTALWYNKDLFARAGIAGPPKTWDELRADAKKLNAPDHAGFCFAAAPTEEATFTLLPWLWQAGGDVPTFGDAASVSALQFVNDLVNVDKSAPRSVLGWGQSDVGDQFGSGLCAMMVDGPWVIDSVQKGKFAWDVAPWPAGVKGTASPLGGEVWAISKGTEHLDAAFDLATWLADPANNRQQLGAGLGGIPNRKDTVNDPAWYWQPMVKTFDQQMLTARPRGVYGAQYAQIAQAIWTAEQQVLAGTKDPRTAASAAGSTIKPLLGK